MSPEPGSRDRHETGERRGSPRIPLEMWVEETTDEERYFRRAGNLSRGGLRLEHTIPLPLGTTVNLTARLCGLCSGSDLILSSAARTDAEVASHLVAPDAHLTAIREEVTLKGFGQEAFAVWRVSGKAML